jgi:hypothetical protein
MRMEEGRWKSHRTVFSYSFGISILSPWSCGARVERSLAVYKPNFMASY